ncbi:MAG: glycosyl hydrolase, partial [Proteobacteria bacterium]|nr:glycosyl hydrolase [Pseudomonadota bacterium]
MTGVSAKGRLTRILICAGVVFTALLTISGTASAEVDEKYFEALEYRLVGPFRGGRSTAVAGDVHNPLTFYMGATGGGVWVTHNAGQTWDNISDGQFNVGSIGAIAVAPSDPNVIYVGTGSAGIRGVSVSTGDGVYRSTDKGKTWKNVGLSNSRTISAIVIHPTNPDLLYVAVQGSSWGPTEDRGIYRSKDGGETWENILYVNDTTGASDIVMDPANTRILYAGMWDHLRRPWEIRSGGEGSGLHKSTDGGDTWETINEGLPELIGKTGVSVSANPDRIYAIIEAEDKKGGLYRSENGGEDWTLINDDRRLYQRAWYYTHVFADPVDENTVYVLDAGASKSIDGGKSFEGFAQDVHGDHHGLWINPGNTDFMINANDGGGTVTVDGGKTWSRQDNQPTAQFYRVNADHG